MQDRQPWTGIMRRRRVGENWLVLKGQHLYLLRHQDLTIKVCAMDMRLSRGS